MISESQEKAMSEKVPKIYEIQNFGASREIPTHRGGFHIARDSIIWIKPGEIDEQMLNEISSAPFVEVREKKNLTGYTVQMLRDLAKKSRIKGSSRKRKSELLNLLGGVQCQS